jgi:di/tricarboxylate transporter
MAGVLTAVISGFLPIFIAAPAGAVLMVLTGCLKIEEAYRRIEMKAIILIAGMLSLGLAMEESGTASMVANAMLGSLADLGPMAVIAGLFLITALSAQVMPTAAVAVLMAPIALSTAASEGLSPYALMMVIAVGSSCAFMSPVGHPVNLLVMGFGGYRFKDFVKVGFPLVILMLIVVLVVLPLVWPLVE